MAHSLRSLFLIAAVATAMILAGPCVAQNASDSSDGSGPSGSDSDAGSTAPNSGGPPSANPDASVLPVPNAEPRESGSIDLNNQAVRSGVASFITPVAPPVRSTDFVALDFFLRNLIGRKLPCTIYSVARLRLECTV